MAIPAEPILGSVLWNAHLASQGQSDSETWTVPTRLASGFHELDLALSGGFDYGHLSCISAESESSAQDILLGTLATHLLAAPSNTATVIDSTLAFDLRRLLKILKRSLTEKSESQVETVAMAAMERIQIMKIFDFEGMSESISEVRTALEKNGIAPSHSRTEAPQPPKGTIGDSEDEEEEMLDIPSPPPNNQRLPAGPSIQVNPTMSRGLLIIDNIAQVSAPLIKNNPAQGQALLTSFLRSLQHLTRTYNLATVIINNAITYHRPSKEDTASIFSSCQLRPALGKAFAYLLDMHLMVQTVPKSEQDSKAIYGGEHAGKRASDAETVDVIEVLQDRYDKRVGRWATLPSSDT